MTDPAKRRAAYKAAKDDKDLRIRAARAAAAAVVAGRARRGVAAAGRLAGVPTDQAQALGIAQRRLTEAEDVLDAYQTAAARVELQLERAQADGCTAGHLAKLRRTLRLAREHCAYAEDTRARAAGDLVIMRRQVRRL